jgi:hypothetical protein
VCPTSTIYLASPAWRLTRLTGVIIDPRNFNHGADLKFGSDVDTVNSYPALRAVYAPDADVGQPLH